LDVLIQLRIAPQNPKTPRYSLSYNNRNIII